MDVDQPATLSGQRRSREEDVESSCSESFRSKRSRAVVEPTQSEMIARLQQAKPPVEGLLGKLLRSDPDKVDWELQNESVDVPRLLRGRYELEICRTPHEVTRAFYEYLYEHLNKQQRDFIADPLLDVLELAFLFADHGVGFEACESVRHAMSAMEFLKERGFWPIPEFLEGEYVISISGLMQNIIGLSALEACSTMEQLRKTAEDYFTPQLKDWSTHPLVWALLSNVKDNSPLNDLLCWLLDDDNKERSLTYQVGYDEGGEDAMRAVLRWSRFLTDRMTTESKDSSLHPDHDVAVLPLVIEYFDEFKYCKSTCAIALELLQWLLSQGALPTPAVLESAQKYPEVMRVLTDGMKQ